MEDAQQAQPEIDRHGRKMGKPYRDGGYATCAYCGVRENTDASIQQCSGFKVIGMIRKDKMSECLFVFDECDGRLSLAMLHRAISEAGRVTGCDSHMFKGVSSPARAEWIRSAIVQHDPNLRDDPFCNPMKRVGEWRELTEMDDSVIHIETPEGRGIIQGIGSVAMESPEAIIVQQRVMLSRYSEHEATRKGVEAGWCRECLCYRINRPRPIVEAIVASLRLGIQEEGCDNPVCFIKRCREAVIETDSHLCEARNIAHTR